MSRLASRLWAVTAASIVIAAVCRLPRLAEPPKAIFDEVYHAVTAREYLAGLPPTEWVHPPTAKLLIAVGIIPFGYNSWAWRLAPALAGIALAPIFLALARRVLPSERAARLATLLLLADGVYLVQSRTAMTNIFAVLFQTCAALFAVRWIQRERESLGDALGLGLALGLALSTRWTSLWAAGFLFLALVAARRRALLGPWALTLVVLSFVVWPLLIYTLSYVPFVRQGHSLLSVIKQQADMWHYHATLRAEHPYFSAWYTWPWLYRPTWYFYQRAAGMTRGIVALGNPALWWAAVPVTLWALITGIRAKDPWRLFCGLGFCALYLPWGLSPRKLNFSHYLLEALPFACLALGSLLDRHWDGQAGSACRAYLGLTIALFIVFFPILTAVPLPDWVLPFQSASP
jgi:dolichyl-phosphate-mannose-protein mannosyltransferase